MISRAKPSEGEEPAHARTALDQPARDLARLGVGRVEVREVAHGPARHRLERPLDHARRCRGSAISPVEECVHGDLVGRVQDARRGPAGGGGLAGEREAGERVGVRRLEGERAQLREVERRHGHVGALGVVQGVGDRHAHVRIAHVRQRRAVVQVDQRVDDRLRVHDHVDPVVRRRRRGGAPRSARGPCSSAWRESIVILPPMSQVGWASASSRVTSRSSAAVRPRNGPPDAVSTSRSTVPGRSDEISW